MFFSCKQNISHIKTKMHNNFDVVTKFFAVQNKEIGIVFVKTLVDTELLAKAILEPLQSQKNISDLQNVKNNIIQLGDIKKETQFDAALDEILQGKVALFLEGEDACLLIDIQSVPVRSPTEPPTSAVIYGPRLGFTESIEQNLGMLRKRLPTSDLVVQNFVLGKYTKTKVVVCHISGIASPKTVQSICKKIQAINIDGILDSNYIATYFQDKSTIFKRVGLAEKPDIVTAKLLEGRVAILVDGSPIAITLPFMIFEDLQNSNDYYTNSIYSSFLRVIRFLGLFIAVILPGVYLALRLYHFKVLPFKFLITISNTTEGLPFTPFVEMIFILVLFQILYEVSLRLPQYLGLATSIVGALILGQTGVSAGLISPPGVIIIALSIIAVYTVTDQIAQLTILRALFLIVGGVVGILGIAGLLIFFVHKLATLDQFGTSYLAPFAPQKKSDKKDGIFMQPTFNMTTRPQSIRNNNKVRQKKREVEK